MNSHVPEKIISPEQDQPDLWCRDGLDDSGGVEMTSSVQNVFIDLQQLISRLNHSAFVCSTVWLNANNKDAHCTQASVARETEAEARRILLQFNHVQFTVKVSIFPLQFTWKGSK